MREIQALLEWLRNLGRPLVVIGFSQGGVIAFEASKGLANDTVLVASYFVETKLRRTNQTYYFLHDKKDSAVPYEWGRLCFEAVKKAGLKAEFIESHAGHRLVGDETDACLSKIIARY